MALTVLIVESNESTRITLAAFFSLHELIVETARTGEAAIQILQKQKFDAIVTSDTFGGNRMTGLTLLYKAKELYPFCNVIITSEHSSPDKIVDSMTAGAYDYITKPIHFNKLENILTKITNLKNQPQDLGTLEKNHIIKVLAHSTTYEEAATILGINMATLWRKRKAYALKIRKKMAA